VYQSRLQIEKKNRYGIHADIEQRVLLLLEKSIEASLLTGQQKQVCISNIRIVVETIKHLVRMEHNMHIIPQKKYIAIQSLLVELSKMSLGWERYAQKHRQ